MKKYVYITALLLSITAFYAYYASASHICDSSEGTCDSNNNKWVCHWGDHCDNNPGGPCNPCCSTVSCGGGGGPGGGGQAQGEIVGRIRLSEDNNKRFEKTGLNCPPTEQGLTFTQSNSIKVSTADKENTWECNEGGSYYKIITNAGQQTLTLTPPEGHDCDTWGVGYPGTSQPDNTGSGCTAQIEVLNGKTGHLWWSVKPSAPCTTLSAPTLTNPTDSANFPSTTTKVKLEWNAVQGATGYDIRTDYPGATERDSRNNCNTHYVCINNYNTNSITIDVKPGKTYTWWVHARSACGSGQQSTRTFTIQTPCQDNDNDGYAAASCGGTDCDDDNPELNPGSSNPYCNCQSQRPAKQIVIRAKGDEGNGWPTMQLWVNSKKIQEWTVNSASYNDYAAIVQTYEKGQMVAAVFTNDYYRKTPPLDGVPETVVDRNLIIDYITIDGTTVQAEDTDKTIYDQGDSETTYFDGQQVLTPQERQQKNALEIMFTSGALKTTVTQPTPPIQTTLSPTTETCDLTDNNCNGLIDEGYDKDEDTFTPCGGDCNDNDKAIYPGAADFCDGTDRGCDTILYDSIDPDNCQGACTAKDPSGYSGYNIYMDESPDMEQSIIHADGQRSWIRKCPTDPTKDDGINWESCGSWNFIDLTKEKGDPYNPIYKGYCTYKFSGSDGKKYLAQTIIHADGQRSWTRKCPFGQNKILETGSCGKWTYQDLAAEQMDTANPHYTDCDQYEFTESGNQYIMRYFIHSDGTRAWKQKCPIDQNSQFGVDFSKCTSYEQIDLQSINADANPRYNYIGSYIFTDNVGTANFVQRLIHADGQRSWTRKCRMDNSASEGILLNMCTEWQSTSNTQAGDPASQTPQITIRAKGQNGNGWPIMQLWVNKQKIQEWTVSTDKYSTYITTIQTYEPGQEVAIAYQNDYKDAQVDRNLIIDYIIINNTKVQAEDTSRTIYDRGEGNGAFDNQDIISATERRQRNALETMQWNGALRIDTTRLAKEDNTWITAISLCCGNDNDEWLKYDSRTCSTGCCPQNTCYESSTRRCIPNGQSTSNYICDSGNWVNKAAVTWLAMKDYSTANSSILCGTYEELLNSYNYPILNRLAREYFNENECFKGGEAPCAGNLCVFENASQQILSGSLSFTPTSADLKELTTYNQDCNAINGQTLSPCRQAPDKLWYDKKTNTFFYSSQDINLNRMAAKWQEYITKAGIDETNTIEKAYHSTYTSSSQKSIIGNITSGCDTNSNKLLNISYSLNTDICGWTSSIQGGSCETVNDANKYKITARKNEGEQNRIFELWQALTSKLRLR